MTSKPDTAFVWFWLPGATEPRVVGRLDSVSESLIFTYGRTYLEAEGAVSLFSQELPFKRGRIPNPNGLMMPGVIRDCSPDAWGRRVILNARLNRRGSDAETSDLGELEYLLYSGSDRIGALDFQESPDVYVEREYPKATLEELLESAARVEEGIPLSPALDAALLHGTSIGGARPKALLDSEDAKFIAKFSSTSDTRDVVKAEFLAMRLARRVGLDVSEVSLERALGKDVLLIRRFDRELGPDGWQRRQIVSALTILGLDEMMARYASYPDLAERIRHDFREPESTLRELFSRMVFNVLCGNTDDHARNHAAFWDGELLTLTPAYDLCPQPRSGNEASQAMLITEKSRESNISTCIQAAHHFLLDEPEARQVIEAEIDAIHDAWDEICDEAELDSVQRRLLWERQFLNPYSLR